MNVWQNGRCASSASFTDALLPPHHHPHPRPIDVIPRQTSPSPRPAISAAADVRLS